MLPDDAAESNRLAAGHVGLIDARERIGQDPERSLAIADAQSQAPVVVLDGVDPALHPHKRPLQSLPDLGQRGAEGRRRRGGRAQGEPLQLTNLELAVWGGQDADEFDRSADLQTIGRGREADEDAARGVRNRDQVVGSNQTRGDGHEAPKVDPSARLRKPSQRDRL